MATFSFEEATGAAPAQPAKAKKIPGARKIVSGNLPKDPAIRSAIEEAADEFGVPREYGFALAEQESGYNPKAYNAEFGAAGMFQYIPDSAKARGIDPYDVRQASRAAMKDFSEVVAARGIQAAIKEHFAGPNVKGHGPKTRQYLADVSKRASDIAAQLGISKADATAAVKKADAAPELKEGEFSFEDAMAEQKVAAPKPKAKAPLVAEKKSEGIMGAISDFADDQFGPTADAPSGSVVPKFFREPVGKVAKRTFEHLRNRMMTDLGQVPMDSPNYKPRKGVADPFGEARDIRKREEDRKTQAAKPETSGFLDSLENPMKLITEDSLPANFIEGLARAPQHQREAFTKARQVMMQQRIVDNPGDFPDVAVAAAQGAIDKRLAKQPSGIRQMWKDLKAAASEDPGRFAAQFANAIIADPEMMLAPMGLGTKLIRQTRRLATGAAGSNRALKIADKVLDAGSTSAALNLAIEGGAHFAEGTEFTTEAMKTSAILGGVLGGALGPIFMRGARARAQLSRGQGLSGDDFDSILRDVANEELVVEDVVSGADHIDLTTRTRIEEQLGIRNMSQSEKAAFMAKRGKELRKTFADNSQEADYLKFKAEERMLRTEQLAAEAAERQAAADIKKSQELSAADRLAAETDARSERFQQDFDAALAARAEAELAGAHEEAAGVNARLDAYHKAEANAVMEDILGDDMPAARRILNSAAKRDRRLSMPKDQRGEIDPQLLARTAVVGTGIAAGVALAPEEHKMQGGLLGGLAGLVIPGGGRVLSRMRQSGAISPDGDIVSRLIGEGKLKGTVSLDQAKAAELAVVERAKTGDQLAYKELYEANYPRMERLAAKLIREAGPKLGLDPADIAQDAFIKAFSKIGDFDGRAQFSTWVHAIVRNEGLGAIRKAAAEKHGGDLQFVAQDLPATKDIAGDSHSRTLLDEGAGSEVFETPENAAIRQDVEKQLIRAFERLPENTREAIRLTQIELLTAEEAALEMGQNVENVRKWVTRGKDEIAEFLAKDMGAKADTVEVPRTGKRGRPAGSKNKQAGNVDPKLLKLGAIAGVGAAVGASFVDVDETLDPEKRNSRLTGALAGAGTGLILFATGGKGAKKVLEGLDQVAGASSTRIMNKSRTVHKRIVTAERRILEQSHKHIESTGTFLRELTKLDKTSAGVVTRALMTGDAKVITRVLAAVDNPTLNAGYKAVRSTLDSLGDQLVGLKRFAKGNFEYFPRIITDKDGLFAAIGREDADGIKGALEQANIESLRKNGRPISQLEESALVNKMLFADKRSTQPGFTKNRGIEEITPELQKFYASPAESLHTYIRAAVQDIERAKFFGTYARNMQKGGHEYLDVDRSVNNLMAEEIASGKLSDADAREIGSILKSRFGQGEHGENDVIRNLKNIGNIGLLGNFWSAASQLGDVGISVYTQGLLPTLEAVGRQLVGKKILDMKDFGLVDHISEEFANQLATTRWVNRTFKLTLFAAVDRFGKNTALNGAIIKAQGQAKTPAGQLKLANKYQEAFGDDFNSLVSDLKSGKITDLTRDYAFLELSRTQPITRIEMPQFYLDHPNLRSYLWLKSFTMKQVDLMRREAYNEIKAGNRARGFKNLTNLGIMMGLSGATTAMVKDVMMGKDVEFKLSDIPINMFKTLGWSEFQRDQFSGVSKEEAKKRRDAGEEGARPRKAEPLSALLSVATPPIRMFDTLYRGDPKAIRYLIPGIGPYLAEQYKKADEMMRAAKKEENE